MRLDVTVKEEHTDIVPAVVWTPDGQLISCGDDKLVFRWSSDGEKLGKVTNLNVFVTWMTWFPATGKQTPDTFAVSCTDGTYRFISKSGREEKKIAAHEGAVILIRWSHDGSAILTAGEDGDVKIWSKSGNLRSCLVSLGQSVYCACWGPEDDQVAIGQGKSLVIKSLQANKKNLQWNAHDGVILCVDWNVSNGNIISGGEDCVYKVWDSFGRQLYASRPMEQVITSIAWSPNGESFAVGSYNILRLCDKVGWTHCRERMKSGSIMSIQWTNDGTQLAAAGGNGSVIFGQIIDRRFEWKNTEVILIAPRKLRVQDALQETSEDIELSRDRIVEIGLGFDQLIVTTTTQCYIYALQNLNTPIILEIRSPVFFLHLCKRHFMTVDQINGIQIISYEGRVLCTPKFQSLRPEFLTREMIALSPDTVVVVDSVDNKQLQVLDATSGRFYGKIVHPNMCEILHVALNQLNFGNQERLLVFTDRNRDLFVAALFPTGGAVGGVSGGGSSSGVLSCPLFKLHSHVESFAFNDDTNALVGLADGRMLFWYHPEIAFTDRDLLPASNVSLDASDYGRSAQIVSFTGNRVALRKIDGSIVYTGSSADIPLLDELMRASKWDEAVRLSRHQKSPILWASLASMALSKRQLDTAEIALAELDEVAKVEYLQYIKTIPSDEGKQAELALFRRLPDEAERILLQSSPPLLYRAIKLNITIFRWNRALDLAVKQKVHIDTVLAYRQKYLEEFSRTEQDPKFLQYFQQVKFNWEDVLEREKQELEEEGRRGGSVGGRSMRK